MTSEELEDLKTVRCCPDHDEVCAKTYYYILELEGKLNVSNDKIKTCLEFIDDLLPKYLEEKSHIIMDDDWELNRSIYVMSELRDRLMGFVKGGSNE